MNDPLDVSQPNAGAFKLVLTVQTFEDAKQFSSEFFIKAGTVITDKNNGFTAFGRGRANFNCGPGPKASELYRIGYQIDPDHPQSAATYGLSTQCSGLSFQPENRPRFF